MEITINTDDGYVIYNNEKISLSEPSAFELISKAWLRCGWDTKYVYSFQWFGRPIIQLPEDMVRAQEVIYEVKPDYIIETGVAHGGSLFFYASLLKLMNKKKVIGVELDLRSHNREAIQGHELYHMLELVDGSSIDLGTIEQVKSKMDKNSTALVFLDSNHSKNHVLNELELYSQLVSVGSYIVATDGIMQEVVGAPRTHSDWNVNNPQEAVREFLQKNKNFVLEERTPYFNEGVIKKPVTYWPNAYLKRIK